MRHPSFIVDLEMRGTFIICLGESYYIIWKIFYSSFSLITVFLIIFSFLEYWLQFFWKFFQLSRFLNIYIVAVEFLFFFETKIFFVNGFLPTLGQILGPRDCKEKKTKKKRENVKKIIYGFYIKENVDECWVYPFTYLDLQTELNSSRFVIVMSGFTQWRNWRICMDLWGLHSQNILYSNGLMWKVSE